MLKSALLSLSIVAFVGAPLAVSAAGHANPIAQRQEAMKAVGGAMKVLGGMAQGKTAYDAAAVQASLNNMKEAAATFGSLFPEGSETGMDTEASPKIWSDPAGFEAAAAQFAADTAMAAAAAPQDAAALGAVFGTVAGNCKACHTDYRVKN